MAKRTPEAILEAARLAQQQADNDHEVEEATKREKNEHEVRANKERVKDLKFKRSGLLSSEKTALGQHAEVKKAAAEVRERVKERKAKNSKVAKEMEDAGGELEAVAEGHKKEADDAFDEIKKIESDPEVLGSLQEEAIEEDSSRTKRKNEEKERKEAREKYEKEKKEDLNRLEKMGSDLENTARELVELWEKDNGWAFGITGDEKNIKDYGAEYNDLAGKIHKLTLEKTELEKQLIKKAQQLFGFFGKGALQEKIQKLDEEIKELNGEFAVLLEMHQKKQDKRNTFLETLAQDYGLYKKFYRECYTKAWNRNESQEDFEKFNPEKRFPYFSKVWGEDSHYADEIGVLKHHQSKRLRKK